MNEQISNKISSEVERVDSFSANERYRHLLGILRAMTIYLGEYNNYKKQLGSSDIKEIPRIVRTMLDKFWNDRQSRGNNVRETYKEKPSLSSKSDADLPPEDLYWLLCSSIDKSDFCVAMNEYISGLFDEYVGPINRGKRDKENEIERYRTNIGDNYSKSQVSVELNGQLQQYIDRISEIENKKQIALEEIEKWSKS